MKKARLGRGLDALIPKEPNTGGVSFASIHEIRPNSSQPRKEFDDSALAELSSSIREKGILQPIVVRMAGGEYEIIAGERRWRAAQKAGVTKVPIIIKEVSDGEALELALIENLQREDLNPVEEALAYQQLIDGFGLTHDDISKRIGKDRSTITNQLRLLKLPDEARQALLDGEITAGHARAILSVESPEKSMDVLASIRKQKLSVRKAENLARNISSEKKEKRQAREKDIYLESMIGDLKSTLGTQVRIVNREGKGKIEIDFYSKDELERLCGLLLGME